MVPMGFKMWCEKELKNDRERIAAYLFSCTVSGPKDSFVWDLIHSTGDDTYNFETFRKAADLVINKKGSQPE